MPWSGGQEACTEPTGFALPPLPCPPEQGVQDRLLQGLLGRCRRHREVSPRAWDAPSSSLIWGWGSEEILNVPRGPASRLCVVPPLAVSGLPECWNNVSGFRSFAPATDGRVPPSSC